jgi:phospholipid-translocating ATPase
VPDPPTSPYAAILPLAFVTLVTAIKQAYEDFLRHKSDREINNSPTRILRNGKFEEKKWRDIQVGDIVEVKGDQSFPCDLLLLDCQTETKECHITTANLDGETNLKVNMKAFSKMK